MQRDKGPRLTKEQAAQYLDRLRRSQQIGHWNPPRAFRILRAFSLSQKDHGYAVTGGVFPTWSDLKKSLRHFTRGGRHRVFCIVPPRETEGWRAILEKVPIDPACWI